MNPPLISLCRICYKLKNIFEEVWLFFFLRFMYLTNCLADNLYISNYDGFWGKKDCKLMSIEQINNCQQEKTAI